MKKTLLLILVLFMLLLTFSISASAEEYTDSLTITDAEAEFFELTDEEKSKFNLKRPEGFKVYSSGNMVELVSQGGSIDEIMSRLFDGQDYIKDVSVVIRNDNNNGCYRKRLLDDRIYTSNDSLWWGLKNYFWDTDKISQLEGLNISEIYCILSEHPLGTVEYIFYYVTDKGDYVILLGSASYVYFMPASALIDCAKKHVEDSNKYGVSNKNMVFSEGIGSGVIREYLINPKTPDVTPTPTPDVEITPTPTPTPMPTPIPEVTPTPTPTPSVTITPSSKPTDKTTPIPPPTISPSETTAPLTETAPAVTPAPTPVEKPSSPVLWIVLGTAAVILLGAVGVLVIRRKK